MEVVFVTMVCLAVAAPLTVMAWAMKRSHCPQCGAEIGPDPDIERALNG